MVRPIDRKDREYTRRPLNAILGVPSHIAVLRTLRNTAVGATGREISQAAGVAHQAALDALERLEQTGIVRRQPAGRAYLFRLNREHYLVKKALLPLLEAESAFHSRYEEILRRAFQGNALAGAIFGSTGRGEESAGSDLDVCLLVEKRKDADPAMTRANLTTSLLSREFGLRLSPIVFTRHAFIRRYREGDGLIQHIVRDAQGFLGPKLSEVVRD